jgi:hypothetical protein
LKNNLNLNLSSVPLLWMENEAAAAGLRLKPRTAGGGWNWNDLRNDKKHESLSILWRPVEVLPITRLSFKNSTDMTRYVLAFSFAMISRQTSTSSSASHTLVAGE